MRVVADGFESVFPGVHLLFVEVIARRLGSVEVDVEGHGFGLVDVWGASDDHIECESTFDVPYGGEESLDVVGYGVDESGTSVGGVECVADDAPLFWGAYSGVVKRAKEVFGRDEVFAAERAAHVEESMVGVEAFIIAEDA